MALISYTSLEPSYFQSLGKEGVAPMFTTGQAVSLFSSTSFLYSLAIMISVLAAGVMYARAGIWRMEASERGVRRSNDEIKRVTLGLLGILSLFVILYTFNKDLLSGNVGLDGLSAAPGKSGGFVSGGGALTTGAAPTTSTGTSGPSSYEARKKSHIATVARLAPSNIHTNYNDAPCTEAQYAQARPACTSLAFLPEETIQMLLKLNADCKCTVVITGGTEPGHTSHGENRRPVDLRLSGERGSSNNTDPIYIYIKKLASNTLGANTNCYEQYILYGFTFCDEKPPNPQHFHVK